MSSITNQPTHRHDANMKMKFVSMKPVSERGKRAASMGHIPNKNTNNIIRTKTVNRRSLQRFDDELFYLDESSPTMMQGKKRLSLSSISPIDDSDFSVLSSSTESRRRSSISNLSNKTNLSSNSSFSPEELKNATISRRRRSASNASNTSSQERRRPSLSSRSDAPCPHTPRNSKASLSRNVLDHVKTDFGSMLSGDKGSKLGMRRSSTSMVSLEGNNGTLPHRRMSASSFSVTSGHQGRRRSLSSRSEVPRTPMSSRTSKASLSRDAVEHIMGDFDCFQEGDKGSRVGTRRSSTSMVSNDNSFDDSTGKQGVLRRLSASMVDMDHSFSDMKGKQNGLRRSSLSMVNMDDSSCRSNGKQRGSRRSSLSMVNLDGSSCRSKGKQSVSRRSSLSMMNLDNSSSHSRGKQSGIRRSSLSMVNLDNSSSHSKGKQSGSRRSSLSMVNLDNSSSHSKGKQSGLRRSSLSMVNLDDSSSHSKGKQGGLRRSSLSMINLDNSIHTKAGGLRGRRRSSTNLVGMDPMNIDGNSNSLQRSRRRSSSSLVSKDNLVTDDNDTGLRRNRRRSSASLASINSFNYQEDLIDEDQVSSNASLISSIRSASGALDKVGNNLSRRLSNSSMQSLNDDLPTCRDRTATNVSLDGICLQNFPRCATASISGTDDDVSYRSENTNTLRNKRCVSMGNLSGYQGYPTGGTKPRENQISKPIRAQSLRQFIPSSSPSRAMGADDTESCQDVSFNNDEVLQCILRCAAMCDDDESNIDRNPGVSSQQSANNDADRTARRNVVTLSNRRKKVNEQGNTQIPSADIFLQLDFGPEPEDKDLSSTPEKDTTDVSSSDSSSNSGDKSQRFNVEVHAYQRPSNPTTDDEQCEPENSSESTYENGEREDDGNEGNVKSVGLTPFTPRARRRRLDLLQRIKNNPLLPFKEDGVDGSEESPLHNSAPILRLS